MECQDLQFKQLVQIVSFLNLKKMVPLDLVLHYINDVIDDSHNEGWFYQQSEVYNICKSECLPQLCSERCSDGQLNL